jgi:type IV secretory pathway TrbD component
VADEHAIVGSLISRRRRVLKIRRGLTMKKPFTREQKMTIVYGILCVAFVLVVLQLWLLTATMNAYLGGDTGVVWPAAIASLICFLLNLGLLRHLYAMDRR